MGYIKYRQIFNDEEDLALENYLKRATDIYYGLTPYESRKKYIPLSLDRKEIAGKDFMEKFP